MPNDEKSAGKIGQNIGDRVFGGTASLTNAMGGEPRHVPLLALSG